MRFHPVGGEDAARLGTACWPTRCLRAAKGNAAVINLTDVVRSEFKHGIGQDGAS